MATVLITGGSSGIGLEVSRLLAADGATLLWVAHDAEQLRDAREALLADHPSAVVHTLTADLCQPDAPAAVHAWSREVVDAIDVLINNAGVGTYGPLLEIPADREVAMIHLNVLATYHLTRLFLADMLNRDSGHIVNISSSSALLTTPRFTTYSATKAFIKQFSESLAWELEQAGANVAVTAVCPAAVKGTPFQVLAGMQGVRTFAGLATTTQEEVARDIHRALKHRPQLVLTGARFRWVMRSNPLLPRRLQRWLIQRELERE